MAPRSGHQPLKALPLLLARSLAPKCLFPLTVETVETSLCQDFLQRTLIFSAFASHRLEWSPVLNADFGVNGLLLLFF